MRRGKEPYRCREDDSRAGANNDEGCPAIAEVDLYCAEEYWSGAVVCFGTGNLVVVGRDGMGCPPVMLQSETV